MEYKEFTAKTVSEAITDACQEFGVTSDRLVYEVIEKESAGFLGIGSKPATIKAAIKVEEEVKATEAPKKEKESSVPSASFEEIAKTFLRDVFEAMKMEVAIVAKFNEEERNLDIELSGDDMGMLIGKRGATLDSLQYLVSLVVNKSTDDYVRVKVDTENYRERRKETLENLAKNIAYKVKRTKRPVSLEPMNPYERRIIHSALQNDKYVTTHSEGEDPFRHVIVSLKK
ncbi:MAG: protein jag [Lachnospiraceae bacterium]|jgi:spoIIIJ-associated protein|nr:protein jag [Lachnospiraceae bacterium]